MPRYQVRLPYSIGVIPPALRTAVDDLSKVVGAPAVMELPSETAYLWDLPPGPLKSFRNKSIVTEGGVRILPDRRLSNKVAMGTARQSPSDGTPASEPHARDARGIGVAILDPDGVRAHPALGRRLRCFKAGDDGVKETPPSVGDHAHGSHMAGVVAGEGCRSLAQGATIVSIRVEWAWQMERALRWLVTDQPTVRVACIASVAIDSKPKDRRDELDELHSAIRFVRGKNVVCCVFAGNMGPASTADHFIQSPGTARAAITVGGHSAGRVDEGTSHGFGKADPPIPDVLLPWGPYKTLAPDGAGFDDVDGTSMSASFMAGAVATWYATNPHLEATAIDDILATKGVCVPLRDANGKCYPRSRQGRGKLDLGAALEEVKRRRPAP
jgi:subtilisin family serine protease